MISMDTILRNALDCIDEGIIIIDNDFEILYWNNYMDFLTGKKLEDVFRCKVYQVLPGMNKNFIKQSIQKVMENGCQMFFSAAMHKNLVSDNRKMNLKVKKMTSEDKQIILLEFIDVTNLFLRIEQLKEYVNKLSQLNEKLKEKEKVIERLAYRDDLTGVANRALFYKFAEKFLSNAKRYNHILGLMFIDVDEFKEINDTYGHEMGDKVMIKVADILTESVRKSDVVARYGGDEFLILLPELKDTDEYRAVASRIRHTKNNIVNQNGIEIDLSLSIGVSFFPNDGETIDKLMAKADKAMYSAKKNSGDDNSFCDTL